MSVSVKREVGLVDGTPVKRMFWSIISDYDLKTGLCELIDNAIDIWLDGRRGAPKIRVDLDTEQQVISVTDNVGGVRRDDLDVLLAPGGSTNDPKDEVIGIFGVPHPDASLSLRESITMQR